MVRYSNTTACNSRICRTIFNSNEPIHQTPFILQHGLFETKDCVLDINLSYDYDLIAKRRTTSNNDNACFNITEAEKTRRRKQTLEYLAGNTVQLRVHNAGHLKSKQIQCNSVINLYCEGGYQANKL